jgi:cyclophilin family peptidyl-prolyl cis-trans isomerase
MKKGKFLFIVVLMALAIAVPACGQPSGVPSSGVNLGPEPTMTQGGIMQWSSAPPMLIDKNKEYTATIRTNFGDMNVQLLPKDAPLAVNNFVFLARRGFYDGLKFHRVVKDFVIQGGDPTGTGKGDPGYRFADEQVTRNYVAGTLAMANAGPNTNGSQFFITFADLSSKLPKKYTIFGQVTGGFDVLQKLGDVPVRATNPVETSTPTVDVHIVTIAIEEK